MNDVAKCLQKVVHKENYEFGLSPLHSYIRFFEYFIHVAYRLGINKWQIRSTDEKNKFMERKREIQSKFRSEMGLLVDKPKPGVVERQMMATPQDDFLIILVLLLK